MDQAESRPSQGQPDRKGRPSRTPPPGVAPETGAKVPDPDPHAELQSGCSIRTGHVSMGEGKTEEAANRSAGLGIETGLQQSKPTNTGLTWRSPAIGFVP